MYKLLDILFHHLVPMDKDSSGAAYGSQTTVTEMNGNANGLLSTGIIDLFGLMWAAKHFVKVSR